MQKIENSLENIIRKRRHWTNNHHLNLVIVWYVCWCILLCYFWKSNVMNMTALHCILDRTYCNPTLQVIFLPKIAIKNTWMNKVQNNNSSFFFFKMKLIFTYIVLRQVWDKDKTSEPSQFPAKCHEVLVNENEMN